MLELSIKCRLDISRVIIVHVIIFLSIVWSGTMCSTSYFSGADFSTLLGIIRPCITKKGYKTGIEQKRDCLSLWNISDAFYVLNKRFWDSKKPQSFCWQGLMRLYLLTSVYTEAVKDEYEKRLNFMCSGETLRTGRVGKSSKHCSETWPAYYLSVFL